MKRITSDSDMKRYFADAGVQKEAFDQLEEAIKEISKAFWG